MKEDFGCCPLKTLNSSVAGGDSILSPLLDNCTRNEREEELCQDLNIVANFPFIHPNMSRHPETSFPHPTHWLPRTNSFSRRLFTLISRPTLTPKPNLTNLPFIHPNMSRHPEHSYLHPTHWPPRTHSFSRPKFTQVLRPTSTPKPLKDAPKDGMPFNVSQIVKIEVTATLKPRNLTKSDTVRHTLKLTNASKSDFHTHVPVPDTKASGPTGSVVLPPQSRKGTPVATSI